ncbi:MAG: hypothetical protein KA265_11515 [Piscinibacter sp.]|nr:hypothetical protein [Piscinibacter sp.]MBP6636069.1 hypothetical protein [Sulfuritalea sp.]
MTRRRTLDDIDAAEKVPIIFPYDDELDEGETIVGAVLGIVLEAGADATPAAGLDGAMLVQPTRVVQRFWGRIPGNVYAVRCEASTSTGNVRVRIAVQRVV